MPHDPFAVALSEFAGHALARCHQMEGGSFSADVSGTREDGVTGTVWIFCVADRERAELIHALLAEHAGEVRGEWLRKGRDF